MASVELKKAARIALRAKRQEIYSEVVKSADYSQLLAQYTIPAILNIIPPETTIIAGYYPIQTEFDCAFILQALQSQFNIWLPVIINKNEPLVFHRWDCDELNLKTVQFGTKIPQNEEILIPDVLLVPLLAYNQAGYRLGYGGGFYDRTLAKIRETKPNVRAFGIAFADQASEDFPVESFDEPLDAIITEFGQVF